jgi:acetyltransferase-like isoleucine patch superfamily enzyme
MVISNVILGMNVDIDPSTSINNVKIGDNTRIAKRCSIFGGVNNILEIGNDCYIGMNSLVNGFSAKIAIGSFVSIAQGVNIMSDSGPNASVLLQRIFPIEIGEVEIGHNCWIGAGTILMPNIVLGEFCVVAANSYVNKSFPSYSIIGGTPAKIIRYFSEDEKMKLGTKEFIKPT